MIYLNLQHYNDRELIRLRHILEDAQFAGQIDICFTGCHVCPYQLICYDLTQALAHTVKTIEGRAKQ